MANKYSPFSFGGVALKTRLDRKTLIILIAGVLVVLGLIIGLVSLARHGDADVPEDTATPAPEATAEPASAPAPALDPVEAEPDAADLVPPDVSSELTGRSVQRRDGFPMLSLDLSKFSTDYYGRISYSGGPTRMGIDVSEHQHDIDWEKVAAAGIDFAIIRMGYRGSTAGGLYIDEYFEQNMKGALGAGLGVGVYFYSQAISVEEALEEANFLLENIKDYDITYPVVFDWEIVGGVEARTYSVSRQMLTECTRAFCDAVKNAGYDPMIYFTRYLGYRKYILRNLTDYGFWYAGYEAQPRLVFDFDMWQYTDTGRVDGISGGVDINLYFPKE